MIEPSQNGKNDTRHEVLASIQPKDQPTKKTRDKAIGEVADNIFDQPPVEIAYYKKKDSLEDERPTGRKNNPRNHSRYTYHPANPQSSPLIGITGRGLSLPTRKQTTAKPRNQVVDHNHKRDTGFTKVQHKRQTGRQREPRLDKKLLSYNQELAAAKDDYKLAEKIFEELKQHQLKPDIYSYNSLLLPFVKNRLVDKAEDIFKMMQEDGIQPNAVTFNTLLDLYVKMLDKAAILNLLAQREAFGLPHDYITYNMLLNYHVQIHDENGALDILQEMQAKGCKPNKVTYTTLMKFYVVTHNGQKAVDIIKLMKRNGVEIDCLAYKTLLTLYVKQGDEPAALRVFKKMKKNGVQPDAMSVKMLMLLYLSKEDGEAALDALKGRTEAGVVQHEVRTYNTLLSFFVKTHNRAAIIDVLKEMQAAGQQPDECTYHTLISLLTHYSNTGNEDAAKELFNQMPENGVQRDVIAYTIMINLFVQKDEDHAAIEIFEQMQANGVQPNEVTYNTLVNLYVRTGDGELALMVLNQMLEAGCKPNQVTFTTLLNFYVKMKDQKAALKVVEQMEKEGNLDEITVQVIIDYYVEAKLLKKADLLFDSFFQSSFTVKSEKGKDMLDCHDWSSGAACMIVRKYLKSSDRKNSFYIVTGVGLHSRSKLKYEMKHKVIQFLEEFYPHYIWKETDIFGRFLVEKKA